jgi:hypothetical protein
VEQVGDTRALAHMRHRQAYTHRWFCQYDQALGATDEGLHVSRELADQLLEEKCHRELGLALAEKIDSCTEQSWLHSGLAEPYRLKGNPQQESEHAIRALALAEGTKRPYDEALARRILSKLGS